MAKDNAAEIENLQETIRRHMASLQKEIKKAQALLKKLQQKGE